MTVEGIDLILKLWQARAPFDFKGDFWHVKIDEPNLDLGIGEMIRPFQQPHPPLAMSVIKGDSRAAVMAGQRGYIPISTNLVPRTTLAQHWETYCAGAEGAGLPVPSRSIWRISRSIFVGRTDEEARYYVRNSAFARSFEYLIFVLTSMGMLDLMKHDPAVPDVEVTPEYVIEHLCIVGDVDSCIEQLQELWRVTGGFGTLLMIAHDWDEREKWEHSMDLLAREVIPKLPSV